jgi:DNA-binding transcriptional MerR regulator
MSHYSIKDVENLSGIKAHTLRIWEQRYEILKPKRTDTNIRYYDDFDLKLILNISVLNKHGHKISKIAQMDEEELRREVIKLSDRTQDASDKIQALTLCMMDMDEEKFEYLLSQSIKQIGFENTMLKVIFPFLNRIGILWLADSVNPAQEHFMTHLIRQKIIVAIDSLKPNYTEGKKYMLFLPEGEWHELSLLFANYLLRSRKQRTSYLGQTLPLTDLQKAYEVCKPDFLFTVITSTPSFHQVQSYINELSKTFPKSKILLSGSQVVGQGLETPQNTHIFSKIEDMFEFIEENS